MTATRVSVGSACLSSSSRFGASSGKVKVRPVTLPPGRARLWAQPSRTGSLPDRVTIGIVAVALRAASRAGWPPARITSTLRRTSSAAIAASRSALAVGVAALDDDVLPST